MINELIEVQEYLEGKKIDQRFSYRICYMLASYYRDQGLDHQAIRERIFEWGSKYKCFFDFSVNSVIYRVMEDGPPLRGESPCYINQNDIEEVRSRFDSKNTRMVALALLAYGKVCANKNGECNVSLYGLSRWLNIAYTNLSGRHFKELVDFGLITRIEPKNSWSKNTRHKMVRVRFNVPLVNEGEDAVVGNNIVAIFNRHFL